MEHITKQLRKILVNDQGFKSFVLGNLPFMMFILIPLFGLILQVLYARRKHLYIKHVVHSLHIHSFAYLNYGLALLIIFKLITPNMEEYEAWRGILAGLFLVITFNLCLHIFLKSI